MLFRSRTSTMKLLILSALVAFAAAAPAPELLPVITFDSYIIGGAPAQIADYPYQSSLRYTGSHTCGSVIMGTTRALTAAHCVDGRPASGFSMYSGSNSRLTGGVATASLTHEGHADYNNGACTFCNDIAMLTFATLSGENIGAGTLPPAGNDFAGTTCTLTGWGRTSSSNVLPEMLMGVDMPVITNADCQTRMNPVSGATVGIAHICIYDGSAGSCNGDSGGPMTCEGTIAGVTSWGVSSGGACLQTYPSVYCRVTTFLDWINDRLP